MKKLALCVLIPFLLHTGFVCAQTKAKDTRPVIAIVEFTANGISEGERELLEDYITSQLSAIREYRVIDRKQRESMLEEIETSMVLSNPENQLKAGKQLAAQGIIVGSVGKIESSFLINLRLVKTETGEQVASVSNTYQSLNALIQDCNTLVLRLFGYPVKPSAQSQGTGTPDQANALAETRAPLFAGGTTEPLTLQSIAGTWVGDKGISSVRIAADGRAVASMPNWATFRLKVSIEGDKIIISQDEPNRPELYSSLVPYAVAKQLSEVARPMRWIFTLSSDKATLSGIKETTYYYTERGKITSYDNTYTREAVWTRKR